MPTPDTTSTTSADPALDSTGTDDELFEADFAGSWEVLPWFDCPPMERLPMAGAELIERRLGIDMSDDTASTLRKVAAVEWFFRRCDGQQVTFRQVLRGGSVVESLIRRGSAKDSVDPSPPGERSA